MNWKSLKWLLSSSLLFTACSFSYHREVPSQPKLKIGSADESTGYIFVTKPEDYVFSYAREPQSKTKFGVAVTTREQQTSENDLIIPSAFIIDCSTEIGNFNLMKIQPAKEIREWGIEEVNDQVKIFCDGHKKSFEHSHW